jgi:bifunctional non-homologous end joining protein LigD
VPNDAAHLIWGVNLGVIDWNPWPVRRSDLDHPDELRVDLDPGPGVSFAEVRHVALEVREVLEEHGLLGFPKTSGSRGIHIYVRLVPEQGFEEVRRAALALAREVERRMPGRATSRWWKEEREGVFIDYNQNARDRTVASAYSVRAVPDARVSCPLAWEEVPDVDPSELRLQTVPERLRERGDPSAAIEEKPGQLDGLLELAARDERDGLGDAPWPPHFRKQKDEPKRVQPSRARKPKPEQPSEVQEP